MECEQFKCPPICPQVFSDLLVFPLHNGGTKVQWELLPGFTEVGPYLFQLQWAPVRADPESEDWKDIGEPLQDTYVIQDTSKRMYGKFPSAHYRVKLLTGLNEYTSRPVMVAGYVPPNDRWLVKAILQEEAFKFKQMSGTIGYLLKRRQSGEVCECVDRLERLVTNPECLICYGTGWVGGYYRPYDCTYVEFLTGDGFRNRIDENRGTTQEGIEQVRMLNIPQVFSRDVWVCKDTDLRYSIETIKNLIEVRSVPIVLMPVEFRLFPFSDVIYKFTIENQQRV